jgi:glycosyltransferase involved in cell wall biosynthesis
MNILMLNYEFPPIGGGASPVTYDLSRHLVLQGHQVDVVTMHSADLPSFERIEGINVYRTPALRGQPDICYTHEMVSYVLGAFPKTLQLVREKKYDVIHSHFIIPTGLLAWVMSKISGIPFIVTAHGSDVPGYNPDRFGLAHKIMRPGWDFLVRHTDLIVSPSESLKELIQTHHPEKPIETIPNGISLQHFKVVPKQKSILMCSRMLPRKGFQYAIEAVKDLGLDWQVNIIGEGPYLDELKKMAANSSTPIKFWGWLDKNNPQFRDLYQTSSIFVFPSESENFPVVLLEAMAAGMAIITSTAGGCPEVVSDAALLVEPRDVDAIQNNLLMLIKSNQLRGEFRQKGFRQVQQFNWDNVTRQYLDCYRRVVKR